MSNLNSGNFAVKTHRSLDVQPTGQVVRAAKGALFSGLAYNNNAAVRYLKIYDKATAPDENDTPLLTIPLAPNSSTPIDGSEAGISFQAGIGIRATIAIADADTGAPTANDVVVNLFHL